MNITNHTDDDDSDFSSKLGFLQGFIYIPIFCAGIINNLSTIIILLLNREMYTVTNCYLLNLAISDTLPLIVSLPFEITFLPIKLPWNEFVCKLRSLLAETSTNASILTISAFTIERYLAVCRPLHTSYHSTRRRAIKIQLIIWFIAILSSMPYFYFIKRTNDHCDFDTNFHFSVQICFHISATIFFVLPAFILCILYALMAQRLYSVGLINRIRWSKSSTTESYSSPICLQKIEYDNLNFQLQRHSSIFRNTKHSRSASINPSQSMKKSAFKMLFAVVIAFIICYAPFHVQRLITSSLHVQHLSRLQRRAITIFYFISGILYYLGASINPIFYHLYSRRYREACRRTIKRFIYCQDHQYHQHHHYHRQTKRCQPFERLVLHTNNHSIPLYKNDSINRLENKYRSCFDLSNKKQCELRHSLPIMK